MTGTHDPQRFQALPMVGILRGVESELLLPVLEAAAAGGLLNLEITMNSGQAADQIRTAVERFGSRMNIGAGTVTSLQRLDEALEAGAGFIVTPNLQREVVCRCLELKVPVFPGALSPTEIVQAWEMGATMVKVFPADQLGPGYLRSVKGPLPQIRLMPTGGVDLHTMAEFAQAGADAFGIGSPLFQPARLAARDWAWLRQHCNAFVESCKRAFTGITCIPSGG